MYNTLLKKLESQKNPIDVIVVGLGFMSFGFVSGIQKIPGFRIPLVISRRPDDAVKTLREHGLRAIIENNPKKIKELADKGFISVSSETDLVRTYKNSVVIEMTGTVAYGTEVALLALNAKKHLITMNPELQATVGTELKTIADKKGVLITDVLGDQPGSLTRLIAQAKLMGFDVVMAGNMKRFMNEYATQKEMQPWADDKGLNVRQTTSFTDGTKQSIEMNLVANYFGMQVLKKGMQGAQVEDIKEVLTKYDFASFPKTGIVDFVIGRNLFPGIFVVVKHKDENQQKYLRYLGLGDGPYYLLFEPYHLCHLEVPQTIANAVLFGQETINNSSSPVTRTITIAKRDLKAGEKLDGIGGDMTYGVIDNLSENEHLLPVGLSQGAIVTRDIAKDAPIAISDVELPMNAATKLSGLITTKKIEKEVVVAPVANPPIVTQI